MISKFFLGLFLTISAAEAFAEDVNILYVDRAADPYYAPRLSYAGTYNGTRQSAFLGAELGLRDAKIIGRASSKTFHLNHFTIPAGVSALGAVSEALKSEGDAAIILDLPPQDIVDLAKTEGEIPLFNIRERSDALRVKTCHSNIFHVAPSDAMISDALAQYLKLMNWNSVLMLSGDVANDDILSQSFERAANKFGLTIVGHRKFVAGNDPRQREQNNVNLLTGGVDYDVIFVADEIGDFSKVLPYRTFSPRPVIGAAGLRAIAWHAYWERNGAPQLNRRFFKANSHLMTEESWAAWVAVSTIVDAAVHNEQSGGSMVKQILDSKTAIELYKGYPGSYRDWDHQLRQSILLGTTDAVVALAPVEGALHERNNLDTLGYDAPEFHCDQ